MRGTQSISCFVLGPVRIIPADAGNTIGMPCRKAWRADHPRGCGEHIPQALIQAGGEGSSPRMRGTLVTWADRDGPVRVIPADAGNTIIIALPAYAIGDHPRGCGEHGQALSTVQSRPGSSPRMRGTRGADAALAPVGGIIPADAGNTSAWSIMLVSPRDHPRGCGEHVVVVRVERPELGSSPRMRGTLLTVSM